MDVLLSSRCKEQRQRRFAEFPEDTWVPWALKDDPVKFIMAGISYVSFTEVDALRLLMATRNPATVSS